jgi:hypothetical protein
MAKNSDDLPRRDRTKDAEKMADRRRRDYPDSFEVGNGGQRVRGDGVRVNGDGHPDGWRSSR